MLSVGTGSESDLFSIYKSGTTFCWLYLAPIYQALRYHPAYAQASIFFFSWFELCLGPVRNYSYTARIRECFYNPPFTVTVNHLCLFVQRLAE